MKNMESYPGMDLKYPVIGSIIFFSVNTLKILYCNILGGNSNDYLEEHGHSGCLR